MSIVERASRRLGTKSKPARKRSARSQRQSAETRDYRRTVGGQGSQPGLIERVADAGQAKEFRREAGDEGARWPRDDQTAVVRAGQVAEDSPADDSVADQVQRQIEVPAGVVVRSSAPRLEIDFNWLRSQNMITPDTERTQIAEGFRRIKRHILGNVVNPAVKPMAGVPANLIMITSALPAEGKTFCSVNLAVSMAMELDRTVLLVDADVAKPGILKMLGLKGPQRGLLDVLSGPGVDLAEVLHRTNIEKLSILPAGTQHRHATELLASEAMRALIHEIAVRYHDRIVIFDSPPLLVASEAAVLASHMSQIIMVVAAGQTTQNALKDALGRLERCELVGLLLNKGHAPGSGFGYGGYGYGYSYGYGSDASDGV